MKNIKSYVRLPFATAYGRLIKTPGYDVTTEVYAEFDSDVFDDVSDNPTKAELVQALTQLWRPWSGYKFASAHDRAAMLASIIGAVCRPGLNLAPGILMEAPMAGSGKTLAAQAIGSLILGYRCPVIIGTNFKDDDEMRKTLIADAISGNDVSLLDNLHGHLSSAALEGLITAGTLAGRILGSSSSFQGEVKSTILLTSNNASLSSDLSRRFIRVRIDQGVERPQSLKFDHCPVERALAERLIIARAVLVVVNGYWAAGSPVIGDGDAGFPQWNRLVRQCVMWLSKEGLTKKAEIGVVGDPAFYIQEAAGKSDPESHALAMLLDGLRTEVGGKPFSARDIVNLIGFPNSDALLSIKEAIEILAPKYRGDISSGALGSLFSYRIDRPVGGLVLRKMDGGKHTNMYSVELAK